MLDDFFVRALLAGLGTALVAGPLGCFIVWRRLAYFGDTLSHSALLGVALGLLFQANLSLAVFVLSTAVSVALLLLQRRATLSGDTLLGLLAHSTLAVSLVVLAFMTWVRIDLMGLLFGDILAVSRTDIFIIWIGGALVLGVLAVVWTTLFASTVSRDLASAEGLAVDRANIVFMLLLAAVVAIAMQIVGILLVTAMLLIPAATARRFSTGPEQMALLAAIFGVVSVVAGLFGSLQWDTPSGPSIVVAALALFVLSITPIANLVRSRTSSVRTVDGESR